MIKNKEIVEIRYYRRKHSNLVSAYGYDEEGRERDIDMDHDGWIHPDLRVEITKEQFEQCHAFALNLMEPYPTIDADLLEGLTDTEGTPIKLGDWVRVECGTLTFDVKVHVDHDYRLVPFDTFGWHKVVKLDYEIVPDIPWHMQVLRRDRVPEPWPDLDGALNVMDLRNKYTFRQKQIYDRYGIEYPSKRFHNL